MGIEVVGVTKRFGSVVAVDDLSLRAERGELLAVVGPSGCGKTTLLRIIAGLEQADGGRVLIHGRDATHWPPERRNVGFVFQQYALFPNMNVAENIGYGLRRRRVPVPERRRRVAELLAMVGLEGYESRRPHELSAGQQQRVALARALAPEPRTLLLDEPLSALDAAIRHQLREELREVQRRIGITTVMVTHDQEEALAVADRVAVMRDGRLEQIGPPWELYDQPATEFVARFVGRGNFFAGRWRPEGVLLPGLGVLPRRWAEVAQAPGPSASGSPSGAVLAALTERASGSGASGRKGDGSGNAAVTALLRPESIVFALDGAPSPSRAAASGGGNGADPVGGTDAFWVRAAVEDVVFGGERAHVHLRLASDGNGGMGKNVGNGGSGEGGGRLVAAVASGLVPQLRDRRGETVDVVIPYDAVRLLPPSP